jgi:hypothetical protein
MLTRVMLHVVGSLLLGTTAPAPKEMPTVTCELTVTGKLGEMDRPDGGEVVITNTSAETIDIGTTVGPLGGLDLKVRDPKGADVKTPSLASFRSPFFERQPHPLKPGESYRAPLSILFAVPEEKRGPGTYKVKAVFKYNGKTYESREIDVDWPGEPK